MNIFCYREQHQIIQLTIAHYERNVFSPLTLIATLHILEYAVHATEKILMRFEEQV